jgi:predicted DCC family thiol-disulfide oxidoreductase YuxK
MHGVWRISDFCQINISTFIDILAQASRLRDVQETAWQVRVLYDGECPLCSREVEMLRRRDGDRGRIDFEDLSAAGFDPGRYGLTGAEVAARIHGVLPDGRVVEGMEVFRRAYAAVGLGWLLAPTAWPGLRRLADAAYRLFARNRLRLTGRAGECDSHRCEALPDAPAGDPR